MMMMDDDDDDDDDDYDDDDDDDDYADEVWDLAGTLDSPLPWPPWVPEDQDFLNYIYKM